MGGKRKEKKKKGRCHHHQHHRRVGVRPGPLVNSHYVRLLVSSLLGESLGGRW